MKASLYQKKSQSLHKNSLSRKVGLMFTHIWSRNHEPVLLHQLQPLLCRDSDKFWDSVHCPVYEYMIGARERRVGQNIAAAARIPISDKGIGEIRAQDLLKITMNLFKF